MLCKSEVCVKGRQKCRHNVIRKWKELKGEQVQKLAVKLQLRCSCCCRCRRQLRSERLLSFAYVAGACQHVKGNFLLTCQTLYEYISRGWSLNGLKILYNNMQRILVPTQYRNIIDVNLLLFSRPREYVE